MSHYDDGEAPVVFVSTVEEHCRQNFYSAEVLLWNSSDNGKMLRGEGFGPEL